MDKNYVLYHETLLEVQPVGLLFLYSQLLKIKEDNVCFKLPG